MQKPMMNNDELAKVEDEAADWAVLLADDPYDTEQLQQFRVWLNSSPLHAEVWDRTCRIYDGLGQLPAVTQEQWPMVAPDQQQQSLENTLDSFDRLTARKEMKGRIRRWSARLLTWKSSLASVALVICLLLVPHLTLRLSADYLSGTGEQQSFVMPDGSKLYLAPESAVDIDYSDTDRLVRLLKGTAFFQVHSDADRPFVVDVGGTRATVLGTAFNVNRTDYGAVVSVVHGQVSVEDRSILPAVSEYLAAGDEIAVTWGKGANFHRTDPEDIARWRNGELIARNQSVGDIVEAFRRYYSGVILVTEPFASQKVTGFYRLNDPVATLTDMAQAHGATARQISPWLLVISQ